MPNVPQLHAEERHHVMQATLGLIGDPNSGMLSTAKKNRIQTIPVYNDGSSRETSPTTDSSYLSAPSSVSNLNSSIQSTARSAYNHELMERYKGYGSNEKTYLPIRRMPVIEEDTRNPATNNSLQESRSYVPGHDILSRGRSNFVSRGPPDSRVQYSPTNQPSADIPRNTADNAESMYEFESDDEDSEDEELEDEDDWSGEDGGLEELVISATEGDFAFAASLIPMLHRYMTSRLRSKVESWQSCAAGGSHGSVNGDSRHINTERREGQHRSRKRGRSGSDHGEDPGEGQDENNDGSGPQQPIDHGDPPDGVKLPMLACPFNKHDPAKYSGTADRKYRTCAGPGFKNIQRLREHLKRTHSPVQCERCYHIFPSNEKSETSAMLALTTHRQAEVPCLRGNFALKEGISDAEWAALDIQIRRTGKSQESHRVEKWTEIWILLFPDQTVPTPWYENIMAETFSNRSMSSSQQIEAFVNLCMRFVNHRTRDLVVQEGQLTESSREILMQMLRQACVLWTGVNGPIPGSHESSSLMSSNNLASLTGSSSTNLTIPTPYTHSLPTLMQTSTSPSHPTIGIHTSTEQPPMKRPRHSLEANLTHSSSAGPQTANDLSSITLSMHNLPHQFGGPVPVTVTSSTDPRTHLSIDNYLTVHAEQWLTQHSGGFIGTGDLETGDGNAFSNQLWPPDISYQNFQQDLQGSDMDYFHSTQSFRQAGETDGDLGNM